MAAVRVEHLPPPGSSTPVEATLTRYELLGRAELRAEGDDVLGGLRGQSGDEVAVGAWVGAADLTNVGAGRLCGGGRG